MWKDDEIMLNYLSRWADKCIILVVLPLVEIFDYVTL